MNKCQPPNCPCFCPTAELPIAPIIVAQGGPAGVITIPIFGTQPFQVAIVTNPMLPVTGVPLIASAQLFNGNVLTITTAVPALTETIAPYVATLQVCNACGMVEIQIQVDVAADITPILTSCLLAQQLWTPEAREPTVGDTLLAFTPLGCRALLPPPDACTAIQAFPGVVPTLVTQLATADCGLATVLDVLALYDLCAALNTFPAGAPLAPGDRLIALQGAACVTTTIADVAVAMQDEIDVCVLLQNLPNAVVQPTAVFYGQQAGACFEFAVSDLIALAAPACPYLAPCDGDCAAPAYSFASAPSSGMWFDALNGAVTISDDNCSDFIQVGASINIVSNASDISLIATSGSINSTGLSVNSTSISQTVITAGNGLQLTSLVGNVDITATTFGVTVNAGAASIVISSNGTVTVTPAATRNATVNAGAGAIAQLRSPTTSAIIAVNDLTGQILLNQPGTGSSIALTSSGEARMFAGAGQAVVLSSNGIAFALALTATGEISVNGNPGAAAEVLTSQGLGLPPVWAPAGGVSFPLLAPDGSCAAPSYSFSSAPDAGMFYTGTAVRMSADNCGDYIEVGASINIIGASGASGSTVTVQGGNGTASNGGNVNISGGATIAGSFGSGGGINITGGPAAVGSNDGGGILIRGGACSSDFNHGGNILIRGGEPFNPNAEGGSVVIEGGPIFSAGVGAGLVQIVGGASTNGPGAAAPLILRGGSTVSLGTGPAAYVELSGGSAVGVVQAGDALINGGRGATDPLSGDVVFSTGSGPTEKMRLDRFGALLIAGNPGVAGQRLTSAGPGLPFIWAP